ncbi:MAG: hypothetical protein ABW022_00700 [Actinoplanes sp.]
MRLVSAARRLQATQISVQAVTRLSSVYLFLAASWSGHSNLALVAIQGTLLAIPYALQESLVGRPLARGVVPGQWNRTAWMARTTLTATLLITPVVLVVPAVTVPRAGWQLWLLAAVPVLLQMPVEGLYWLLGKQHRSGCGNLVHQCAAAGTIACATVLALSGHSVLLAAVPAQLLVIGWALGHLRSGDRAGGNRAGGVRPGYLAALRPGSSYSLAAVVSLAFGVALPTLAGVYVGEAAVVVIRALDLAFGPFHLLLNASVREDLMRGRRTPLTDPAKLLAAGALAATGVALIAAAPLRQLISADLAAAGGLTVAVYTGYKLFFMINTWQASRHMLRTTPRRFMTTGIVASCLALVTVAAGGLLAGGLRSYLLVLCGSELLLIAWYAARSAADNERRIAAPAAAVPVPAQGRP